MDVSIDSEKTLDVIEKIKLAKIGEYKKWEKIIKKLKGGQPLNQGDLEYYSRITRIYKNATLTSRSRIYHTRLSEHDEKPPCTVCAESSLYYCNINDQYFCTLHIVGHDENEY